MGDLSEAAGLLTQLRRQGTITSAGSHQFLASQSSGVCSPKLIPRWCLSSKGNLLRHIDQGQKLKFKNLKNNLTFGTLRPVVLVIRGEEEFQDQGREWGILGCSPFDL